ncbi:hypothetical protein F53441_1678 [Fusarium austroafricanum]|uniref:Uncharacterized protein n=1 Tax=Fusarium austroafricanum TaxID=2364996 RepID=A0A8H4P3Q6_9HYPO|nr:hypothetical protein F53441_1678 [Fusarium austroafricanum]
MAAAAGAPPPGDGDSSFDPTRKRALDNLFANDAGLRRLLRDIEAATEDCAHIRGGRPVLDKYRSNINKKGQAKPPLRTNFLSLIHRLRLYLEANENFQTPGRSAYVADNPTVTPGSGSGSRARVRATVDDLPLPISFLVRLEARPATARPLRLSSTSK